MSQIQEPTTTEIMGKVVEAVVAVQDAEKTVVDEGQRLVRHMQDPAAHGAGVADSIIVSMPKPVWEGSKLGFTNGTGTLQVPSVELRGPAGLSPSHSWEGSALCFQNPDGVWGTPVELKGPKGDPGTSDTPLSSSVTSESEVDAATSLAAKIAYDKAQEALQAAQANNSWSGLAGKPDTFVPSAHATTHTHDGVDAITPVSIGALPEDGNAVSASTVPWDGVLNKPATFAPSGHAASHGAGGLDRLTPADIGALPAGGKAASANVADTANAVEWANVSGKPASFPVTSHAASHAAGGSDAITPASIGALSSTGKAASASTADNATNAVNAIKWNGASRTVSSSGPSGGVDGDVWFQYI